MNDGALIILFAVVKGALIAIVATALDIQFWRALILAVVSGVIGAMGAIVAAVIAARAARRNRTDLEHIKHKLGADRRAEDNPPTK
jgi:zinc transporter ZupT